MNVCVVKLNVVKLLIDNVNSRVLFCSVAVEIAFRTIVTVSVVTPLAIVPDTMMLPGGFVLKVITIF